MDWKVYHSFHSFFLYLLYHSSYQMPLLLGFDIQSLRCFKNLNPFGNKDVQEINSFLPCKRDIEETIPNCMSGGIYSGPDSAINCVILRKSCKLLGPKWPHLQKWVDLSSLQGLCVSCYDFKTGSMRRCQHADLRARLLVLLLTSCVSLGKLRNVLCLSSSWGKH